MKTSTVPKLWPGETCYILGGGQSLDLELIPKLQGKKVIAINNAYQLAQWIPVLFFMDQDWAITHAEELRKHRGIKYTINEQAALATNALFLRRGDASGLSLDPQQLNTGMNSGHCAINLAVHLGVKRIILLGYDMQVINQKHNWHDSHERSMPEDIYRSSYMKHLHSILYPLAVAQVTVLNASPQSALKIFEKVDINEVI